MKKRTGTWLALCLAMLLACGVAAADSTPEEALVQNNEEIGTVVSDSENEDDYITIDGALYQDDATEGTRTLVKFPDGAVVTGTFTVAEGTTHIASKAFYEQKQLTAVIMPETLVSIGAQAFHNCENLAEITVGDATTSVTNLAFSGCEKLTNVILRDSATDLSEYIRNLSTIETFTVQDTDGMGFYAIDGVLYHYGKKDNQYVRTLVKYPQAKDLNTTYTVQDGTDVIGNKAFYNMKALPEIVMPETVSKIGAQAFWNCKALTTITIGDNTSVSSSAFSDCTSLTTVILRDSVTAIADYIRDLDTITTFQVNDADNFGYYTTNGVLYHYGYDADNVLTRTLVKYPHAKILDTKYTVQADTAVIGSKAFYNMKALPEIVMPETVSKIGAQAFWNCKALTTITIGDNTSVSSSAFSDCTSLTTVILRDSVTAIADYIRDLDTITTFQVNDTDDFGYYAVEGVLYHYDADTKERTLVKFPEAKTITGTYTVEAGTTVIGAYAMRNLKNMDAVLFPATVKEIQSNAFNSCSTLASVYFSGDVPTSIGKNAFSKVSSTLTLYYPAGNTSGWTSPTWVGPDKNTYTTATWIPEGTTVTPDPEIYNATLLESMQKYFSGYSVTLDSVADIDGDKTITRKDAMILARYLADWEGYANYFKLS